MTEIKVLGMSCGHCVSSVTTALNQLGLTSIIVDLESGTAKFDKTDISKEDIINAIEEIGFEVA